MNYICHCDEECFTYINITTGERSYVCGKADVEWEDSKIISSTSCDFREIVMDPFYNNNNTQFVQDTKNTKDVKRKQSKIEFKQRSLDELVETFLINPKVATFQMIENISNERFDSKVEDIYSYLNRMKMKLK